MGGEHNNKPLNGIAMCKFLSIERVLETYGLCGGFQLGKIRWTEKNFLRILKINLKSKDETDGIQITNVLTSVTENEKMQTNTGARKNIKSKFLQILKKRLVCMQEILVLFQ